MEFRKFDSLENTYNEKMIHYVRDQLLDDGDWIVTEKIDGANFAFYINDEKAQIASRNQFVDTTFFACGEVVSELLPAMQRLYSNMGLEGSGSLMVVYGELYGPNIQGRVNYGPKGFVGFDILIDGEAQPKMDARTEMAAAGIPVVPRLYIGSFEGALAYRHAFQSFLTPDDFNEENECEGVVIEPALPTFFHSGKRVYLKHKTDAFSERKGPAKVRVEADVPEAVSDMLQRVAPYLSESRVHSVISKLGEIGKGDFGKVLKLTVQDAIEDFEKEAEVSVGRLLSVSMGLFLKLMSKEATATVRSVFLQKL